MLLTKTQIADLHRTNTPEADRAKNLDWLLCQVQHAFNVIADDNHTYGLKIVTFPNSDYEMVVTIQGRKKTNSRQMLSVFDHYTPERDATS